MVYARVPVGRRQFDCFTQQRHEQVSILVGNTSQDSRFVYVFAVCSNNLAVPKPAGLARRTAYKWARRFEHVAAIPIPYGTNWYHY